MPHGILPLERFDAVRFFVVSPLLTGAREEDVMPEDRPRRERQNPSEDDPNDKDLVGRVNEPDAGDVEEFEDIEEDDEEDLE